MTPTDPPPARALRLQQADGLTMAKLYIWAYVDAEESPFDGAFDPRLFAPLQQYVATLASAGYVVVLSVGEDENGEERLTLRRLPNMIGAD